MMCANRNNENASEPARSRQMTSPPAIAAAAALGHYVTGLGMGSHNGYTTKREPVQYRAAST